MILNTVAYADGQKRRRVVALTIAGLSQGLFAAGLLWGLASGAISTKPKPTTWVQVYEEPRVPPPPEPKPKSQPAKGVTESKARPLDQIVKSTATSSDQTLTTEDITDDLNLPPEPLTPSAQPAEPVHIAARAEQKALLAWAASLQDSYPPSALRRGEQGEVRVMAQIDANGRVSAVKLVTSSGSRTLDDHVLRKLMGQAGLFVPATTDGKPESAWVTLPPIRFVLRD
jgi:periplasmic protein TonB